MNTEELKNLINKKPLFEGKAKDETSGKLAEVLNELAEQTSEIPGIAKDVEELQGKTPHLIKLTSLPTESISTHAELREVGLIDEDINDAANGQVAYLVLQSDFIPIRKLQVTEEGASAGYILRFEYNNNEYRIQCYSTAAHVTVTPISDFDPKLELSALPTADITSLPGLNSIGLTNANLKDIALGKKCFIYYDGDFYQILSATYSGDGVSTPASGTLKFARFYIDNSAMAGVEYDIVFNEIPSQPTSVTIKQL